MNTFNRTEFLKSVQYYLNNESGYMFRVGLHQNRLQCLTEFLLSTSNHTMLLLNQKFFEPLNHLLEKNTPSRSKIELIITPDVLNPQNHDVLMRLQKHRHLYVIDDNDIPCSMIFNNKSSLMQTQEESFLCCLNPDYNYDRIQHLNFLTRSFNHLTQVGHLVTPKLITKYSSLNIDELGNFYSRQ